MTNVVAFPSSVEAQLTELTESQLRLKESIRAMAETFAHQIQAVTAAAENLSTEEFDALFGSFWLINYRACILVEALQACSGHDIGKLIKNLNSLKRRT